MSPLLDVEGLSIFLGDTPIVQGISFSLKKGKTLALLGGSGSGKSITALALMRLLPVNARYTATTFMFDNIPLLKQPEAKWRQLRGRRIALIFQEPMTALNPVIPVGKQIAEVYRLHFNYSRRYADPLVLTLLDEVGIPDPKKCYHAYPHELSGGMKQRIVIAMALAGEPDLLISDESTTALDVTIQAQILELLKTMQKKRGMAIIFITHHLAVAREMADEVAVMLKGRLVEQASRDCFFSSPKHAYSQSLFNALLQGKRISTHQEIQHHTTDLLEVKSLYVAFPEKRQGFKRKKNYVVKGVDLALKQGETLALVGGSGSGKTTVGKSILQLVHSTGSIHYQNRSLSDPKYLFQREIQLIFQDPHASMDPRMLVGDIIAEGLDALQLVTKKERQQTITRLLEQVDLPHESQWRYPHEFSGGQRQRICIARALAVEPSLLICDEPTSALDVLVQARILNLLKQLQRKRQLAYLFITHDMSVVSYLAHNMAVMHQGVIVEYGTVDSVLRDPQHPYTQQLIAAIPSSFLV